MAEQRRYPGAPRWAKVLSTIVAAVILLFIVALAVRGPHRPGMHSGHRFGEADKQTEAQ